MKLPKGLKHELGDNGKPIEFYTIDPRLDESLMNIEDSHYEREVVSDKSSISSPSISSLSNVQPEVPKKKKNSTSMRSKGNN